MNRTDFAEKINVKPAVIYNLTAKNTRSKNFTADLLTAILHHCPELSPSWVLTGEGDMLKSNITQSATIGGDNNGNINTITSTASQSCTDRLLSLLEQSSKEKDRLQSHIERLTDIIDWLKNGGKALMLMLFVCALISCSKDNEKEKVEYTLASDGLSVLSPDFGWITFDFQFPSVLDTIAKSKGCQDFVKRNGGGAAKYVAYCIADQFNNAIAGIATQDAEPNTFNGLLAYIPVTCNPEIFYTFRQRLGMGSKHVAFVAEAYGEYYYIINF